MKKPSKKQKKVDEVIFAAIALPSKQREETGGLIAWSVGWSRDEVLETMAGAFWPRHRYRIARCRLVEMPKRKGTKKP